MKKIIIISVAICMFIAGCGNKEFVYNKNLDSVAVEVDGDELTLRDLSYYVYVIESRVQEQSLLYNADKPSQYWNLYIDESFVRSVAKSTSIDMAVHDQIYYKLALEEGYELSDDDMSLVSSLVDDEYDKMSEYQRDALSMDKDSLREVMERAVLAQTYANRISETLGLTETQVAINGEYYNEVLKEHEVTIKDIWEKVDFGKVTIDWSRY